MIGDDYDEVWKCEWESGGVPGQRKAPIPAMVREFNIELVAIRSNQPDVKPTKAPTADIDVALAI